MRSVNTIEKEHPYIKVRKVTNEMEKFYNKFEEGYLLNIINLIGLIN
jgi:hypothetical protein